MSQFIRLTTHLAINKQQLSRLYINPSLFKKRFDVMVVYGNGYHESIKTFRLEYDAERYLFDVCKKLNDHYRDDQFHTAL